jgi:hypothetical protein
VAQLGARFHGMEEVVSSNLTRSTKTSPNISRSPFGVQTCQNLDSSQSPRTFDEMECSALFRFLR